MGTMDIRPAGRLGQHDTGVSMTAADIEEFLEDLLVKGRAPETVERYRRSLERLGSVLPEDGMIRRDTLEQCREALLKNGCAPRTANLYISVANTYVAYMGHREYQFRDTLLAEEKPQPEMSRGEYRHLLQVAKLLGREKVYLLVKLFAGTDLPVQELEKVTVEAAKAGYVTIGEGRNRKNIHLPRCLCGELLAYADRNGLYTGPLFLARGGEPLSRVSVTTAIRELCVLAQVPVEKGNPRCLRRLYQENRKAVEDNIALLVDQALERQLEEEQLTVAWNA